jgi:tRNA-splicing ligase RtcB (3'-phosphate/5'-hydroxy nucleic acid ligase)
VPFAIRGNHDENTIAQMEECMRHDAVAGVLCADGHKGYAQPVGGVTAYRGKVSISGVGFDIACGNMAVKLSVTHDDIKDRVVDIGAEIAKRISFGIGRKNETRVEHPLFEDDPAWEIPEIRALKDMAQGQLGTVGSGNHYVDVFRDETNHIWIGVHFGSRGLGHKITTHYLRTAGGMDGMDVPPTILEEKSDLGEQYIKGMKLGGRYAYAGREWVVDTVREIIGGEVMDSVHNHHNFAWQEEHGGELLWVIRKGATPAFLGQRGFVGGSMGDISVILRGKSGGNAGPELLYSTVHGAGRLMSRTQAAGKKKWIKSEKRWEVKSPGLVDEALMRRSMRDKGILLIGAGADEAPQVYKPLRQVLECHSDTIEIEHTLTPLIVAMAGNDIFDPFKD